MINIFDLIWCMNEDQRDMFYFFLEDMNLRGRTATERDNILDLIFSEFTSKEDI